MSALELQILFSFLMMAVLIAGTTGLILFQINQLERKINNMAEDVNARLAGIETNLNEASTEILAELERLKGESLSEEGRATLGRLEELGTGLANIANPPSQP